MTIVQLDKVTFFGAEAQKRDVIRRLQELGCAHLIELRPADGLHLEVASDAREALKYLRGCPEQTRQVRRADDFDRDGIVDQALRLRDERRELRDTRDQLRQAIQQSRPWGDFQLPAEGAIGDVRLWFYVVPLREIQTALKDPAAYEVSRDNQNAYVVVLGAAPPKMPGTQVELDPRPLSQLRDQLEDAEERLADLHHERVGLTRWGDLLAGALDEADDEAARGAAATQTLVGDRVYALQAWIPHEHSERVRQFADEHELAATIEPPAEDDDPPTLLHNSERVAGGEGLVTFYKAPGYGAWDPSAIAYISFAIFFAMIVADAGYGLVMAAIVAYLWKSLGATPGGRRSRRVLASVVGCTVLYGVLCGSYFGVAPAANSPLAAVKVFSADSQSQMMPLAIVIGVVHLSLANLIVAWLKRDSPTALAPAGWVAVMFGALLAAAGSQGDGAGRDWLLTGGAALLVGGLLAVFLFSSERPFFTWSPRTHLLRVFDGLMGLAGVSGLFGDVLSYLRLFALGLSSARLAVTFNELGARAWDEAGFGVILAIAIVILGHSLNLLLSIMSGVVHGLRLNCIEFFKWSLPDEGHLFKPFAKKARQP